MIHTLKIAGFRGFKEFELNDLGHINLLVGTNNSGKTTVLECLQMMTTPGYFSIFRVMSRRGEEWIDTIERGRSSRHADVRRLFHGHELKPGKRFSIQGIDESKSRMFNAEIVEEVAQPLFEPGRNQGDSDDSFVSSAIRLNWSDAPQYELRAPITRRGGISFDHVRRNYTVPELSETGQTLLVATAALSPENTISMFEDIVLTKEEDLVIEALNVIEPSIERMAASGSERLRVSAGTEGMKGGLVVKCKGISDRIPIGSMGDGVWRMLGLSLSLVQARDGILLVDEIDTGLHFTVMEKMWKLIYEGAKRLNVQVFATTHSRDCYESLASICRDYISVGSDVTIQRIEKDRRRSVAYTEQEIVAAADRCMEVR